MCYILTVWVQYLKLVLFRNSKYSHHKNTSICLSLLNISSERFSILGSQFHICIIPVWHGFKGQCLRQCQAGDEESRYWWHQWCVEVDILCSKRCEAASCPRHTIVVPWPVQPGFLSSLLSAVTAFNIFHSRALTERAELHVSASATCGSVWLHEPQQLEVFLPCEVQVRTQVFESESLVKSQVLYSKSFERSPSQF